MSLVGPGATEDILTRHYGESLAGLGLLGEGGQEVVDIGSGAGFPAQILAAVRTDISVTLVEANERKWSFLLAASRKASLKCRCLNARVGSEPVEGLPSAIDVVTSRGVETSDLGLDAILPRLSPSGSLLLWAGESTPQTPTNLIIEQEVPLVGSRQRRILKMTRRQE